MNEGRTNNGFNRYGAVLAIALAGMLAGCVTDNPKPQAGAQTPAASDSSPAAARSRIAKICVANPDRFFGGANTPARCDCYGDGVAKKLSKEELSYVVTYNEIPSLSANEYDKIKERCLASGGTPDGKAGKKKAAAADKDNS
jgi:hypothetical protein